MTLTEQQIKIMQEDMSAQLVELLMEKWGYSMEEALSVWYNSDTFARLSDTRTGLYYQSAGYVYSFLENELKTGVCA